VFGVWLGVAIFLVFEYPKIMEQGHPIPRQITTFEFKLIGFLTLKQFIYLVIFIPAGYLAYALFPLPLLNILVGIMVGGIGFALAFVPVNDRPLEIWIRNLIKRLTSPTQYFYKKQNQPLYFLQDLFFVADPHRVIAHIQSQKMLNQYLAQKQPQPNQTLNQKKQQINQLLSSPPSLLAIKKQKPVAKSSSPQAINNPIPSPSSLKKPFLTGVVKNNKMIPLSGILIYIKDQSGKVLRLLKTNPHGVFATFNPLAAGEYLFELKDPQGGYFFDTMKLKVESKNQKPLEFFSKELL